MFYQFVLRRRWCSRAAGVEETDGGNEEKYPTENSGSCRERRRQVCDSFGTRQADNSRQVVAAIVRNNSKRYSWCNWKRPSNPLENGNLILMSKFKDNGHNLLNSGETGGHMPSPLRIFSLFDPPEL